MPLSFRELVPGDLRQIYRAAAAEEAQQHPEEFALRGCLFQRQPGVAAELGTTSRPFSIVRQRFARAIYDHHQHRGAPSLRKIIKTRGAFPNEDAALKLIFLAIRHVPKKWTMTLKSWSALKLLAVL